MTDDLVRTPLQAGAVGRRAGVHLLERLPLAKHNLVVAYGFAIVASVLATALRFFLDDVLPPGFPYLTFFPAVIVTAFFFGLFPGLLSAALCGLAAWYWFIPPTGFALTYASFVALSFYLVIVGVDITLVHWMQRANAHFASERRRADDLAETREMLFRELQHRVGNNLQMVASLLSLQSRSVRDPEALNALGEASRRVALVGRIQRTLYDSSGAQLVLDDYIRTLVADTITAAGREDITFHFVGSTGQALIGPANAIPLALVVAEAVSNAIEHAFADGGGTISVSVDQSGGELALTVRDDGSGLPEGFDLQQSNSLGLRIAQSLTRALEGTFHVGPCEERGGTCATIRVRRLD